MSERTPAHRLDAQGIETGAEIHWNLTTAPLVEHAVARGEGLLAKDGPLVVETGKHTGRTRQGQVHRPRRDHRRHGLVGQVEPADGRPTHSTGLKADFLAALRRKETLFVADLFGGSQPEHRVHVRVINELAWHNLFIRTMLVRPEADELAGFVPEYHDHRPAELPADPERHGCRSETVIAVNLDREADPDRRHRICAAR